jgi:Flp pilus assembly protein TadG
MLLRSSRFRRPGRSLAELALVYPVLAMLVLGVVIVAMGVFRYQQVASVARAGARWASVHGGQYASETGNAKATAATVYSNAIQPMAAGLDLSQLSYTVTWTDSSEIPTYNNSSGNVTINQVTVTVTYNWVPVAYLGTVTLKSTSVMAMQY